MNDYTKEMKKCISLARQSKGLTSPNPMVGCVVINSKGKIISSGRHKKYGEFHAERNALINLKNAKNSTLVVNLEPCCHYGQTPPCTDIIIKKGVKRVVFGMYDPNPKVSGKGIKLLKDAGIEVIGPVLEEECKNLNEVFIKNQIEHKTFVAIKTATTIDGKIAAYNGDSKWITSDKARKYGKKLRQFYDAVLTSSSTVVADNPAMVHKVKVILDRELKTDLNSNIYKQGKLYVFYDEKLELKKSFDAVTYIPCPVLNDKLDIKFVLDKLFELGIMSIFVESGGILNSSFLPYADKIYHFTAPKILSDNSGKSCFTGEKKEKISECFDFKTAGVKILAPDVLTIYKKYE